MTLPSASGGGRHKQTSHVDSGASGLPLRNVGRRSQAAIYAYMPLLLGLTRRRMLDPSSSPSATRSDTSASAIANWTKIQSSGGALLERGGENDHQARPA